MNKQLDKNSEHQAYTQLESILEMVFTLEAAGDDDKKREEAEQAIHEDPLSVLVRSDWHEVGKKSTDAEFEILLCTGGPAVRLIGELNEHQEPINIVIEHQDWGTPWTQYHINAKEEEKVLVYCQQFYFGE